MTLSQIGERGFIKSLQRLGALRRHPGLLVGVGDDAAVLRPSRGFMLFSTDMMVEGRHFTRATIGWEDLGWKAAAACGSDMVAMGGTPRWIAISLAAPGSTNLKGLHAMYQGIQAYAKKVGAAVVGGDTTSASRVVIDVAMIGEAMKRPKLRSGAKPGDAVMVTGTLGDAAMGWEALRRGWGRGTAEVVKRFRHPPALVKAGMALGRSPSVHAMMDLSDGLGLDLSRMCEASGVGVEIWQTAIPISRSLRRLARRMGRHWMTWATGGGEDYQLLWTCRSHSVDTLKRMIRRAGAGATVIGRILPRSKGLNIVEGASRRPLPASGFQHY